MAKYKDFWRLRSLVGSVCIGLAAAAPAAGQDRAAIDAYLMDENREVALARSAATEAVSGEAAVYVLRREGYHRVSPGTNGFHCLVQRSFTAPTSDPKEFYEPRVLAPVCFTPDAARTLMQRDLLIAPLVASGMPLPEIRAAEAEAYASGRLTYPDTAVFAYMLSSAQWLGAGITHWHPHVMIWTPGLEADDVLPSGLRTFGLDSGLPVLDLRYGPKQPLVVIPVTKSVHPATGGASPGAPADPR